MTRWTPNRIGRLGCYLEAMPLSRARPAILDIGFSLFINLVNGDLTIFLSEFKSSHE